MKTWIKSHHKAITHTALILIVMIIVANVVFLIAGNITYLTKIATKSAASQLAMLEEIERAFVGYGIDLIIPGTSAERLALFRQQLEELPGWGVIYYRNMTPIQNASWYHDFETVSCVILGSWLVVALFIEAAAKEKKRSS